MVGVAPRDARLDVATAAGPGRVVKSMPFLNTSSKVTPVSAVRRGQHSMASEDRQFVWETQWKGNAKATRRQTILEPDEKCVQIVVGLN